MTKNRRVMRFFQALFLAVGVSLFAVVAWPPGTAVAITNQNLVALTNQQRAAAGIQPLAWSGTLSSSAELKADDMCTKDYWSHNSPDGLTPWTFMERAGYKYTRVGENLAKGFTSDEAVIAGWMASPAHRDNILDSHYTEVGFAERTCTLQGSEVVLVVAHYGRPAQVARYVSRKPISTKNVVQPTRTAQIHSSPVVQPTAVKSAEACSKSSDEKMINSWLVVSKDTSGSCATQTLDINNSQFWLRLYKTFFLKAVQA